MKKVKKSLLWLMLTVPVVLLLTLYFLLVMYYCTRFGVGTWINGEYCTGRSVEEVNDLLLKDAVFPVIQVMEADGNVETITLDTADCKMDYTTQLETLLREQNPFGWIGRLNRADVRQLNPSVSYDREVLRDKIQSLQVVQAEKNAEPPQVTIQKTDQGFLLSENLEPVPDGEKITNLLLAEIEEGQDEIDLPVTCYKEQTITEEMLETLSLWEKIDALQRCGIVYDMGDTQVPIDAAVIADWIAVDDSGTILTDESGNPMLKENCFREFIDELADEYDTYNVPREFATTRGDVVTIENGTYGNRLNRKAEAANLKEAFLNGTQEIHTPVYEEEALYKGKNDIGDTYIEVDMTAQMMYYYVDGELFLETPVVTGNLRTGHGTPTFICSVYLKQKNRILGGGGVPAQVDYWMPVYRGIGIHDAKWRNKFGGEIYKTNGSHGCINTPYDAVKTLYENVEVGTPVIMYY